jgi:hypothetical protein
MPTKVCSKCGEEKDMEEFCTWNRNKDKKYPQCKKCQKKWRDDPVNKKKARDYFEKNKDVIAERRKRYYHNGGKEVQLRYKRSDKGASGIRRYSESDHGRYTRKAFSAKRRGIEFDLSEQEFSSIFEGESCSYCGMSLNDSLKLNSEILKAKRDDKNIRALKLLVGKIGVRSKVFCLDRKDSMKGYSIENCCLSCVICNNIKGWAIHGDQYKLIAPAVIDNIVRICKEAGMSVPLPSSELGTEHECGEGGGSMDGGLLHGGRALFEAALDVPVPEVCDPVGSLPRLLRDAQ